MSDPRVVLLSIPALRPADVQRMPNLASWATAGESAALVPNFPCVTCPVQANMTTGLTPAEHGVVANGFYWRTRHEVEMWTAWNDCILAPQIWDLLHRHRPELTSAAWFVLHSKGCGADFVCTPAPIHNADGSESLWCHTRPETLYPELVRQLDHFPLHHFWGPMANIASSEWIADSAVIAAERFRPHFFLIYLPHLDYAAQRNGPDSPEANAALSQLDVVLGQLRERIDHSYGERTLWLVAGEYAITPVDHVSYPNRALRKAGLLTVRHESDGEHLDLLESRAWTLVDHQLGHVFVRDRDSDTIERVAKLFQGAAGIAEVLVGDQRRRYQLDHERSGDVILISHASSWQAYYWWTDDALAPAFAHKIDIHSKPGYDPVELFLDLKTMRIPLDATLVRGSHGAPARMETQRSVMVSSERGVLPGGTLQDNDVAGLVLRQFGI